MSRSSQLPGLQGNVLSMLQKDRRLFATLMKRESQPHKYPQQGSGSSCKIGSPFWESQNCWLELRLQQAFPLSSRIWYATTLPLITYILSHMISPHWVRNNTTAACIHISPYNFSDALSHLSPQRDRRRSVQIWAFSERSITAWLSSSRSQIQLLLSGASTVILVDSVTILRLWRICMSFGGGGGGGGGVTNSKDRCCSCF